ncbi:MAG TPA: porin family protein [Bacteroidales bacterium]
MKKLSLIALVVLFAISASAQVQFGIKAGLNIANQKASSSGMSFSPKSLVGFHVGAIADFAVGEKFAIQPGLLFSQKGCKADVDGTTYTDTYNYLDIPINAVYKIDAGGVKVLLNAGPSISFALSAKEKGGGISENLLGSEDGQAKSLDFGFGIGGGLQFGSVVASLNYNFGLANIMHVPSGSDATLKNNVFSISLAYMFGGK